MFIAKDQNGILISIEDVSNNDKEYLCPVCGSTLNIKRGNINLAHFAHKHKCECDDFTHDMSLWHRNWQRRFPIENQEITLE